MKKVLFIATSNMNKRTGGGLANLAYYNSLTDQYRDNVDLVAFEETISNTDRTIPIKRPSITNKVSYLFKGQIHRFSPKLEKYILNHSSDYSLVIFNGGLLGDIVSKVKKCGLKLVTIHHNYEVEFQMDNKKSTTLWGLTDFWVRKNENLAYKNSDINLFLTEDDLCLFKDKYGSCQGKCAVVGVYEPFEKKYNHNSFAPVDNRIVISGSLNSVQTTSGIKDLEEKYFGIIKRIYRDDFYLTLTGRGPSKYICQFANKYPQVSIIENPDDIYSIIKTNGIFFCPTNIGGGLKLRVMDGLSQGLPILVHKTSARGYNMFYNKPWFQIYYDQNSFEQALCMLRKYIEKNKNIDIRKEIQTDYINYFSYSTGSNRLIQLLNE